MEQLGFTPVMGPKDKERVASGVEPDQTAPSGAVWSWSALFVYTHLSQKLQFYGTIHV